MFPDNTTLAPARAVRIKNRPISVSASNLRRKIWLIASYDPAKTGVNDDVPKEYLNANQVGDELGYGFSAHYLATQAFKYGSGVSVWITPQKEASGATAATCTLTVTASNALAGTLHLFVNDDGVDVPVSKSESAADIAAAIVAKVNADHSLPVTAANTAAVVTFTAKSKGTFGLGIKISVNLGLNQTLPSGVTVAITSMTGGATDPDIQDALDGNGTGDASNTIGATDGAYSYKTTADILSKIATWVGLGDTAINCWAPTVGKPVRFVSVSTEAGSTGYNNMKTITDGAVYDRANAYVGAPDAYGHPAALATAITSIAAQINQAVPHDSYVGEIINTYVGTDRWTDAGTSRQSAIAAGISCTRVVNGQLTIDGMVSLYRPSSIPENNNAYRAWRNISIFQNILKHYLDVWAARPRFTIVEDIAEVDPQDKPYVLDINGVKGIVAKAIKAWKRRAWIFESDNAIKNQTVTLRTANNGFDITIPIILSGEGVVSNTVIYADINLTVYSN